MAILVSLILAFCTTLGLLLRYAPFAPVATPRQKKILLVCYLILGLVNLAVLLGLVSWQSVQGAFMYLRFGMIVYAVIMTVVNILVIPGRIREHLFVFGVVSTCNYLLMAVPNFLITFLPPYDYTAFLFIVLTSYTVLLVATYFPLKKLICSAVTPVLHLVSSVYWSTIWFIPIALFGTRFLNAGGEHNSGSLLQLLSSGLAGAIIILMCQNVSEAHQRLLERQAMERQLLDQKVHYGELQAKVEDARKTRHDLKHHIAAILHFVERDDKEGCRTYCQELMDRTQDLHQIPYTGNTATDGVLYHYMQRAADHQIDLQIRGVIHSHGIADMDLCVLLGNALDNALAGCLTIDSGRQIQVVSQSEDQLLSIMIRNTYDGTILQGKDGLLSRKRENSYGVGMRSMETVCKRYGGSLDVQYDESAFTVMFVLPMGE